jgi:hypothetical protein
MSRLLVPILLLTAAPLWGQIIAPNQMKATLRVDVVYGNGSHAGSHLRVQLRQGMNGTLVAMDVTNTSGDAEFTELDPGEYAVKVTGDGIEPADSGSFTIEATRDFLSISVTVKPAAGTEPGADVRASGASVAAADLNVPKKAAKEFERGGQEMAQENWDKAVEHLDKAIEIYPQYSSAYNDLAVCYGLPHQHFAIVHYTAASALEEENRIPEAISELQLFLQEEPQGSRAEVVRRVLVTMQNQSQNQGESQAQSESEAPPR